MTSFEEFKSTILTDFRKIVNPNTYDFYLIFGSKVNSTWPWDNDNWNTTVSPLITNIISASEYLKHLELKVWSEIEDEKVKKHFKQIKHGKLSWKTESFDKWTLKPNDKSIVRQIDLTVPSGIVCEKNNFFPDIFISFQNEDVCKHQSDISSIQFDFLTIIAIKQELQIDATKTIVELSKKLGSKITIYRRRRWDSNFIKGKWTFVNWIPDTTSNGIYEGECIHKFDISTIGFEPVFETVFKS